MKAALTKSEFALNPDEGPPRLIRFMRGPIGALALFDKENNLALQVTRLSKFPQTTEVNMGKMRTALRAGVSAFVQSWHDHAENVEKAAAERYIKKQAMRNEAVQKEFATLSANDQHFLEQFTENLTPEERPDHGHMKRVMEIIAQWPIDAQITLMREIVSRCPQVLVLPSVNKWCARNGEEFKRRGYIKNGLPVK